MAANRPFRSRHNYPLPRPLNPHAAATLLRALIDAADSLTLFPLRGRPGLVATTRELVTIWPYILIYEVNADVDTISILRVRHGAQERFASA